MRSMAALPLMVDERPIGALLLSFDEPRDFDEDQNAYLAALAAVVAQAMRRALAFRTQQTTSELLQRSLLPESVPELEGLAMGAYYESGGPGVDVGGDWYDVLPLADGRVAVTLGDVMGKGVGAAIVMGQVRCGPARVRPDRPDPDVVLERLDLLVSSLGMSEQIVTVAYAVIDGLADRLTLALAGHPSPILAITGSEPVQLDLPAGAPLGLGAGPWQATEVVLPPEALLLLFSDGLIETRTLGLADGVRELCERVAGIDQRRRHPRELCARLAELMRRHDSDDDVTMLAVMSTAGMSMRTATAEFPADSSASPMARRALAGLAGRLGGGRGRRGHRGPLPVRAGDQRDHPLRHHPAGDRAAGRRAAARPGAGPRTPRHRPAVRGPRARGHLRPRPDAGRVAGDGMERRAQRGRDHGVVRARPGPGQLTVEVLRYTAFSADPVRREPGRCRARRRWHGRRHHAGRGGEVGYSESAFLLPRGDGRFGVRYFSPLAEVPFCGHATIATAVAHADRFGTGPMLLDTRAGEVAVSTVGDEAGRVTATLTSVPPRSVPLDDEDRDRLLAALRWSADDLDGGLPLRVAYAGAWHPVVAVRERSRLADLSYDFDALGALMAERDWTTVALVCRSGPTSFDVRNPFPPGGVVEDPAPARPLLRSVATCASSAWWTFPRP
jgi:predicted PhzF superfamily epimerase YddE/YHI9/serine phosphatase RsbU (regulator of sigma subunit)